ncbi:MAG: CcmD family protein [Bacteroidota bacterium]
MRKILALVFLTFLHLVAGAQVQMADDFRGEGKIYIVLAIFLLILAGFFWYLFKLDRRTKRLENDSREKDK